MPPSLSSQESSWITIHIIQPILNLFSADVASEAVLRKFAYFTEFLVLSVLVSALSDKRLISFYICFTVAFLDESIQLLSGRGSQIQDVWIDLIGVLLGFVFHQVGRIVVKRKKMA